VSSYKMKRLAVRLLLYLSVLAAIVVLVFPVYWMVITSLLKRGLTLAYPPKIVPKLRDLDIQSYVNVIRNQPILIWFRNSAFVTGSSVVLAMVFSTLAGYSMSRFPGLASRLMGILLIVIRMLPDTLMLIPLYIMFNAVGLIDSLLSLVIYNVGLIIPFAAWMMKGFFDAIPRSLEEAAQIDGCGFLSSISRVIIPLTIPGLAATAIYAAVISWSNFVAARTFISSTRKWTVVVGTASMIGEHLTLWDELMAMSTISVVPLVVLFMFLVKRLVAGMAAGAVKQ
jgi:multiple sugar transport system permease protein